MGNEEDYFPLVTDPPSEEDLQHDPQRWSSRREKWLLFVIVLQSFALIALMFFINALRTTEACKCPYIEPLVYSPAQAAVEYEVKSFTPGHTGDTTIYQGLSDEADRAWGELYNHTILRLPRSEAALLPNKTYPIKQEPGYYLGGIDVFHQLHCLNTVRRALHKEYYISDTDLDEDHVSHCVDSIRQSLMCNADISVNVWQWSEELSLVVGYSTQAHSCKNFNKLLDWARARRLRHWIDHYSYIEDDLPTPPVIS